MNFTDAVKRDPRLFIGIDLGTSGVRVCVIDTLGQIISTCALGLPAPSVDGVRVEQSPKLWWRAVEQLLKQITQQPFAPELTAMAIDGTSGSVLLTDDCHNPIGPALMYNDARAHNEAKLLASHAPSDCGAHGPTSSLAKLLWLQKQNPTGSRRCLHQADWILGRLMGKYGVTDENNALKLGYDPQHRCWPEWLDSLKVNRHWLPDVCPAGQVVGLIDPQIADRLGLARHIRMVSGTTDSIAGLVAAGARHPGDAVTSLGSTLVLKIIATFPLFSPEHGVYSHRLGDYWLVGGASNSGGAVLRQFFSQAELDAMTPRLRPDRPTGLDYYPLPAPGERFPIADPAMPPRLTPRPQDPLRFFQGLLEGIANIERMGYQKITNIRRTLSPPCS